MIASGAMVLFQSELKLVTQFLECSFCAVDSGERDEVFSTAAHTPFYSDFAFAILEQFVLRGLSNVLDLDGDFTHAREHFALFFFFRWLGHIFPVHSVSGGEDSRQAMSVQGMAVEHFDLTGAEPEE